jgi:integrase
MEPKTKLLDQMRLVLRLKHVSLRTERAYINWAKRFIVFHDKRHPKDMGAEEIRAFLIHLALDRHVAASTQNVALNALLFLYRDVLQQDFPELGAFERAKRPRRLPTVFTRAEVAAVLAQLAGGHAVMASLLSGAGLRLLACLRLRVQDVDFASHQIVVRSGKGEQDRVTMVPRTIAEALQRHRTTVQRLHEADLAEGYGEVSLPDACACKEPHAGTSWVWQ